MSSNPIQKIKDLILELPETDVPFGNKYLNTRDFESLQSLDDSAIIRVKKGLTKENPKEEYLKVDLEKLSKLKVEVDTYYSMIEVPTQDIYEDFDNEEFSEEFNEDFY